MITVLYICTDWYQIAGSSASLINLITSVREEVFPMVLLPRGGAVQERLEHMGIRTIVCPFYMYGGQRKRLKTALHHPTRTQLYMFLHDNRSCARYVKKMLKDTHVDIVHSNTTLSTVGVNIAKALNAKHVWHIREYLPALTDIYRGEYWLKKRIESADVCIFVSNPLRNKWEVRTKKSVVLWNAIRSDSEITVKETKQKYFLFCAASIYFFKRPDIAISAFSQSGVFVYGYRLKMVGYCDEVDKKNYLELASSLNCAEYIDWIDYSNDVKSYFENATAFLMCSEFEGLGRVTAEAMFYGCPVIGRNLGGTKDLIQDGYNGYLFDTEQECAKLKKKVVSEDNTTIIKNAQTFVRNELTEEVYGKKLLSVYTSIVTSK